jgi:hypothetical protein
MPLTSPDGYLDFTNAVPRAVKMVATSNVGIGTSSPIYALDVHGTSNTGPLTVSSLTLANGAIEGDLNISGNLVYTSNTTTVVNSNVVVEYTGPHGRDPKEVALKKYPEIAFAEGKFDANDSTNTYVQAGYTVTASTGYFGGNSTLVAWKVHTGIKGGSDFYSSETAANQGGTAGFIGTSNTYVGNSTLGGISGEWVKTGFPFPVKIKHVNVTVRDSSYAAFDWQSPSTFYIIGSHDGTTWSSALGSVTDRQYTASDLTERVTLTNNEYYKYYAVVVTKVSGDRDIVSIDEIEYYGYEEDPPVGDSSLDATFKSVLNTPQTTGVQVYVDAKLSSDFTNQMTDPTPVGTAVTHNDTGKYWELTGALTSNVTVEANTFLEGDQPHAVSVWFNSSNLEANTANTCVFTISDQENLDSYNLDLQSNTWHNLTYSYQGEGGSRVTYLDGRKVSEDQAEDTFGDYPPFAMTGYSQGGYVVSASTDAYATTGFYTWKAFNDVQGNEGWHAGEYNDGSTWHATYVADAGGAVYDTTNYSRSIAGIDGEWLKIEMPHKLVVDYLNLKSRGTTTATAQSPKDFKILGSNDDTNWDVLATHMGVTYSTTGENHVVSATKGYKYLAIVVTRVQNATGNSHLSIGELSYHGHRENDLVRLPDPTHVLKYPHVTLTEDARRGYVVSASGNHSNGNHPTWKAFDGDITNDWQINGGRYSNSGGVYTHNAGETTVTNVQSRVGDWVQLESPHKIRVKTMKFTPIATYGQERSPATGVLVGSNDDGSTWTEIKVFDVTADGTPTSYTAASSTILAIDSGSNSTPGYYKIHRLIWLTLYTASQTTYADRAAVADLEFYGTGVDSIPIQIGGGNIDRVANFRVYDRFVEEDQALEIWDAQKEEFGRAKSSMTLHKGRLGIGTDEPQGRLAVADEPDPDAYGLQEFPPRGMTEYETYIEEHGVFRASAGTKDASAGQAYLAFNKTLFERGWHGGPENDGRYTNSLYLGTLSNGGYLGDWIRLDLPYKVKLNSSLLYHRDSTSYVGRMPKKGVILGSNDDGGSWELVHSWDNETYSAFRGKRFDINSNSYFKSFILVVQELVNTATNDPVNLGEWRLFGYREQVTKQSVLHDGQLTLTKNLTVPSIGPSVTDTRHVVPRRHRLVVEFDTSTNPTDLATVKDTSGMGNDGTLRPSAHYSIKEKAFVFDGSGDYIDTGVLSPSLAGAHPHSVSVWFKTNAASGLQFVTCLGEKNGTTGDRRFSAIRVNGSSLQFWQWSNDLSKSGVISADVWYHVVAVYLGGGTSQSTMLMYLNGERITSWDSDTTDGGVLGLVSPSFAVGEDIARSTYNFNGQISKPLVYDTVLAVAEVKTLYAMGRGDPYHVTNFQNTLVGINLGDGRAPRSALDVRDQIYARTSTVSTFTGQHRCVPEEPVEKGLIVSAKKNRFVKLNGGLDTGKSAITIDESLPVVSLSSVAKDKACFGVVSSMEEANSLVRVETVGGVISDAPKTLGDNRAIVNSVGEGAIWVVNTGGHLESGDYITTSNVAGYGQKQDDDVLHNYTVAKITMDCDFTATEVPVQTIKREETGLRTITEDDWNTLVDYDRSSTTETQYSNTLEPEAYIDQPGYTPREVTTIVDYTDGSNTISVEEWSNLESNIQSTYQSNTFTEIVDYIKFVTADEWSNLTSNVQNTFSEAEITTYYQIQRGENVLDENGQLQWEDKTGATEAPYERRFLDASGVQTDEANAVHIAAFVGCTYHCG